MSEVIGNRYQITKLIGKGGMAEVYLAWDSILNREVAVKVLKSDMANDDVALERFKREANSTTQLSHPNIVDVYDVGDDGDKHYIVMEYIKGYTLKQLIKKRGAIPYKEAVWMMKQLAGALMEAHRKGIIHRDVKSQNVLIKPDGTVKLSDFGIALANGSMELTSKDSILGSVHYLAPELSRGRQASMQSDIYSLGIVFYELLTGDVPFKGETAVQVALMHVKNNIPSVRSFNPTIPQTVQDIVNKATAKSLNDRYKNIALMLQDLNVCLKNKNNSSIKTNSNSTSVNKNIHLASDDIKSNKKKKMPKFAIILLTIVSTCAIVAILFLSGNYSKKNKMTIVPNVINMNLLEAKDVLSNSNLVVDESHITYEMSDTIEKGKVISSFPSYEQSVEKNTKVKLTISNGINSVLGNYVGKNYKEAEEELKALNFFVRLSSKNDTSAKPGIVLSQSLQEGYKFNAEINNEITLEYAVDASVIIDLSLKYASLEYAKEYFENNDIEYEFVYKDISDFSEDELKDSSPNTVIETEPKIGSSYTKDSGIIVKVYYYDNGV